MKSIYVATFLITLSLLFGNGRSYAQNDHSTQAQATATASEDPPPERGGGRKK